MGTFPENWDLTSELRIILQDHSELIHLIAKRVSETQEDFLKVADCEIHSNIRCVKS